MEFASKIYISSNLNPPMIKEEKMLWTGLGVAIIGIIGLIINEKIGNFQWFDIIGKGISIVGLLIFLYGRLFGFFKTQPLNGTLTELIKITPELIQIGTSKYRVQELNSLKFMVDDYKGKMYRRAKDYPGPWASNGTNNSISFEYKNQKNDVNFIVENKTQLNKLKLIIDKI
jgi:hypothetical protein